MGMDESALALAAKADEKAREELITRQEKNILRIVSRAKHRFVTKSDDEWAIALCAFSHAIDTYQPEKGVFLSYAETLIRRSLIDAYRQEARHALEFAVPPEAFDGEAEDGMPNPVLSSIIGLSARAADHALRDEILAANMELRQYGFSFFDLTRCSPAQDRTREACQKAANAVLACAADLAQLARTRQLPIKRLIEFDGIPKKILERYRKYIIATVIIRAGDYPALQGYIRGGRGKES